MIELAIAGRVFRFDCSYFQKGFGKMRKFIFSLVMVGLFSSVADASILGSFLRKGLPGSPVASDIEDRNKEFVVKRGGGDATRFEVGDSVELYLQFETYAASGDGFFSGQGLDSPFAGGTGYRLYGRGSFLVEDILDADNDGVGDFTFSGSIEFSERTDGVDLFPVGNSIADSDTILAGATPFMTIGTVASDDFIKALDAPINLDDIPSSGTAVDADFGLSVISSPENINVVPDFFEGSLDGSPTGTFHDIIGSTQTFALLGPGNDIGDDLFDLRTNSDIRLAAVVPEPGAIAIWSVMVMGSAVIYRRRRNRA